MAARDAARGDRHIGTAAAQAEAVLEGVTYDLIVETTDADPGGLPLRSFGYLGPTWEVVPRNTDPLVGPVRSAHRSHGGTEGEAHGGRTPPRTMVIVDGSTATTPAADADATEQVGDPLGGRPARQRPRMRDSWAGGEVTYRRTEDTIGEGRSFLGGISRYARAGVALPTGSTCRIRSTSPQPRSER